MHNSLSLFFCGVCSKSKGVKGQKEGFIKLQRTEETGEEGDQEGGSERGMLALRFLFFFS